MNKTKIEWCDYTWNPVTGCLHGCEYCYARKIAKRFGLHYETDTVKVLDEIYSYETQCMMTGEKDYISSPYPYDFYPTFHKYHLAEPQKVKKPQKIFVCSMADLFGDWVPDEWIKQVFDACEKAPQHTYLFLTKNPKRYLNLYDKKLFPYKENFWFGTTLTKPSDEYVLFEKTPYKTFISIEPLLEGFGELERGMLPNWVIVGAETGNRKDKVIPEREWIESIVSTCHKDNVQVFMKNSLKDLMGDDFIQEWPEELKGQEVDTMCERLTKRDEYGNIDIIGVDSTELQLNLEFDELNRVTDALNRLAAYEDTGLSPEEIISSLEDYKDVSQQYANFVHEMQPLKEAKADGLLVELPCKVGELMEKYRELTESEGADEAETYTTGYRNGHRNGQAELLAYLLQIDTGCCEASEKAIGGGEG